MTTTARTVLAAMAAGTALAGVWGAPAFAHGGDGHTVPRVPPRLLADARAATAQFHNPAAAIAAGFVPTDVCFPGMGQHWVNWDNVADGVHDVRKPDILLYEPTRDGVRLVGVEWFKVDADQDLNTDEDRPYLVEGLPFDGPMLGHEEGGPVHYDLHLYIWKHNPDGTATSQNPRVSC